MTSDSIPETTPTGGTQKTTYFTYSSDASYCSGNISALCTRTDARGVVTTYSYDALNRLTQIAYNVGSTGVPATATIGYTYDQGGASANALGRLTSMTDGVGSETYTYDVAGRLTQLQKTINGSTFTTCYGSVVSNVCQQNGYNLASELKQITYPSGRVVATGYDATGRICGVGVSASGCTVTTPYASNFTYSAPGQLAGFTYGNGVVAAYGFSANRLQLTSLAYTFGSTTLFSLGYGYTQGQSNNGRITNITDNVDGGRSASYTYDPIGRLAAASTPGSTNYPAWGLSFTYDRYGNRTAQSIASGCTGITCPTNSLTVSNSTNQVTGTPYTYDANGNMTNDGYNTLTYDAENRIVSVTNGSASATYSYDGNGLRVKKALSSTSTVYIFLGGTLISEYDNGATASSPSREYLYAGGALISKVSGGTIAYYHRDHLSNRLVTDSSGNVSEQLGHFPYGEAWYDGSAEKWRFTTYERDSESGNDYAIARFYVNRFGRFSSTDPLSGNTSDPQSLNRYAYVTNDPINGSDPSGLAPGHAPFEIMEDSGGFTGLLNECPLWEPWSGSTEGVCGNNCGGWDALGLENCGGGGGGFSLNINLGFLGGNSPFGEVDGLPYGINFHNIDPLTLNQGCDFGTCSPGISSFGSGLGILLPQFSWASFMEGLCDGLFATMGGMMGTSVGIVGGGTVGAALATPEAPGLGTAGGAVVGGVLGGVAVGALGLKAGQMAGGALCPPFGALFSKSKQNVADTGVMAAAQELIRKGVAKEICEALQILYDAASGAYRNKIKATQKANGCRASH
jgi:RHS repeat-associated protein